jgi:hypothetical protein
LIVGFWGGTNQVDAERINFERDVAPLLMSRCLECHHTGGAQGGLDLSSRESLLRGGESGEVLVPGADDGYLLQRLQQREMPPAASEDATQALTEQEISTLQAWMREGLAWNGPPRLDRFARTTSQRGGRDWWAFQPVVRPAVPKYVGLGGSIINPIDAFVANKLAEHGWQPAPRADRRTLARRAYVDLWGLPPTAEQIEAFVTDTRPDAWPRLIDTLLASPRYGQRWARHWLDVVRFAETCGYERDQLKPNFWRYRDWVVDALNSDMPYDRFLTEQLAGDELPDASESTVIATGMLRAGTWNDEPNDPADYLYERLEDMVHTTTTAFLGLTVKCARCHDHKFDPIPQTDYYRMASFFWAGYIGQENLGGPSAEQLGYDVFGWTDRAREVDPIRLLRQGERHQPDAEVPPGFLSAIPALDVAVESPPAESRTTKRRLQLARWVTHPENPLTARVMVNRLWLHHFGEGLVRSPDNFGFKGELPTHPELLDWLAAELVHPSEYGDVAAASVTDEAWRLKRIHGLIMTSDTYCQASIHPEDSTYREVDAANRLWWKANRRRFDAETLHDAMLMASGELNDTMGGPSYWPRISLEALEGLSRKEQSWEESPDGERNRRSIYMMTKRSRILPLMTAFDFCDTTRPCGQRDVTIVPTQALALLNNPFVHERSTELSRKLIERHPNQLRRQLDGAWLACLARLPTDEERTWAEAYLQQQKELLDAAQSLESLCHVLLNTNEFVYVD